MLGHIMFLCPRQPAARKPPHKRPDLTEQCITLHRLIPCRTNSKTAHIQKLKTLHKTEKYISFSW